MESNLATPEAVNENNNSNDQLNKTPLRQTPTNTVPTSPPLTENAILEELSKDMIKTTGDYIKGEIDICIADYKILEQMNKSVAEKYSHLAGIGLNINNEMSKLNEAYLSLTPLLAQIDDVEKCVAQLEQSANKLDNYSKRLEAKYKQFSEKYLTK